MTTRDENNRLLNEFMGWKIGQECERGFHYCFKHNRREPHDAPMIDYYADTPEAREAARLLKDKFVEQTRRAICLLAEPYKDCGIAYLVWLDSPSSPYGTLRARGSSPIESHAIADAIAAALRLTK